MYSQSESLFLLNRLQTLLESILEYKSTYEEYLFLLSIDEPLYNQRLSTVVRTLGINIPGNPTGEPRMFISDNAVFAVVLTPS